jgi:hypothetical protein
VFLAKSAQHIESNGDTRKTELRRVRKPLKTKCLILENDDRTTAGDGADSRIEGGAGK